MITLRTMIILFIVGYFLCPAEAQWSWVPSRMFTSCRYIVRQTSSYASTTTITTHRWLPLTTATLTLWPYQIFTTMSRAVILFWVGSATSTIPTAHSPSLSWATLPRSRPRQSSCWPFRGSQSFRKCSFICYWWEPKQRPTLTPSPSVLLWLLRSNLQLDLPQPRSKSIGL